MKKRIELFLYNDFEQHNIRFIKQKNHVKIVVFNVVPPGIEPGTHGFSVHCSTN